MEDETPKASAEVGGKEGFGETMPLCKNFFRISFRKRLHFGAFSCAFKQAVNVTVK